MAPGPCRSSCQALACLACRAARPWATGSRHSSRGRGSRSRGKRTWAGNWGRWAAAPRRADRGGSRSSSTWAWRALGSHRVP